MRVKGRNVGLGLHFTDLAHKYSHEFSLLRHYEGEKCANINMPLKEKWLGVHRTQVLLTQSWSRSNSPSPLGSPLFISHMAWPPVLLTQDTGEGCWENHTRTWARDQYGKDNPESPLVAVRESSSRLAADWASGFIAARWIPQINSADSCPSFQLKSV